MIARFTLNQPNTVSSPCGSGLTTFVTGDGSGGTEVAFELKLDDEVILSTANLVTYDLASNPVTVNMTNGKVANLQLLNGVYTLEITYPGDYQFSDIWKSTVMTLAIAKDGYQPFSNTFELFNFDIGNDPAATNAEAAAITYNIPFEIVMVENTNTKPYSAFLSYRQPFTDLIKVFNTSSSLGYAVYKNTDDDTVVLNTPNGQFCHKDEISIYQSTISGTDQCDSADQVLGTITFEPEFSCAISCSSCAQGCTNTINDNTATPNIDYTALTQYFVGDTRQYPFQNQQIIYTLWNSTGALIDSFVSNFQLGSVPVAFVGADHAWVGFSTPEIGSYVVKMQLNIVGLRSENIIDSTGVMETNRWYEILDTNGGFDATGAGATDNAVGEDFAYNGETMTWGDGSVLLLTNLVECWKTYPILSCSWFDIERTDCNTYKIYNRSFDGILVSVVGMDETGTFPNAPVSDYLSIPALGDITITLSEDNIWRVQREVVDDLEEIEPMIFIVYNYCSMRTCILTKVNELLCGTAEIGCESYCVKYYDFLALMTTAMTYFNLLNSEYNFNYFYDALSPNKLADLYDVKQLLDRIKEYCGTSTDACPTCSGSTTKCSNCS